MSVIDLFDFPEGKSRRGEVKQTNNKKTVRVYFTPETHTKKIKEGKNNVTVLLIDEKIAVAFIVAYVRYVRIIGYILFYMTLLY
jgi:hypothetical protein